MLARILDQQAKPQVIRTSTRLESALVENWRSSELGPPPGPDITFRASFVHKLCPRLLSLAQRHQLKMGEVFSSASLFNFALGRGMHREFQKDALLKGLGGPVLHGWWAPHGVASNDIDSMYTGEPFAPDHPGFSPRSWIPRPEGDDVPYTRYIEVSFEIPEFRMFGHVDGILVWPDGIVELLELKKIAPDRFYMVDPREGGKPFADNVAQVHTYLWGLGLDRARLVYVNLGAKMVEGALAEHEIQRDNRVIKDIQDGIKASIAALEAGAKVREEIERRAAAEEKVSEEFVNSAVVMKRMDECPMKSQGRAKYCELRDLCFYKGWKKIEAAAAAAKKAEAAAQ